jgi:hypothetical protein
VNPTPYQSAVLAIPENVNVLLAGGRGGGKSVALGLVTLRHVEKFKDHARPLIVRETYKGLTAIEEMFESLFATVYGSYQYNRAEKIFRLPNEASLELGQLDDANAYKKYQGRGFSLLGVDEYGLLKDRRYVALLKSNLRAREGIPLRTVATANPGGNLHTYIHRNHVLAAPAWHPYEFEGETWINAPSTFRDNPNLDGADYERKLRASANDDSTYLAWRDGDRGAASLGSFFGADLDVGVHMLPAAWPHHVTNDWLPFIALDWGSSAPCVAYLCLRAPGGIGPFPRGSLILLDEIHTAHKDDLSAGMKYPPGVVAEMIQEMCARWTVRNIHGVGDDAYGIDQSLLDLLANDFNIHLEKPEKQRASGWQAVRQLLKNAKDRNGKPGLWATERCFYFWQTMPFVGRDANRPEDLDTNGLDHGADAVRYAAMHATRRGAFGRAIGLQ